MLSRNTVTLHVNLCRVTVREPSGYTVIPRNAGGSWQSGSSCQRIHLRTNCGCKCVPTVEGVSYDQHSGTCPVSTYRPDYVTGSCQ